MMAIDILNDENDKAELTNLWRGRVRSSPEDSTAWLGLGVAYADDRRIEMALEALDRAIQIDGNVEALGYRARLLASAGRHAEAKEAYAMALQVTPADHTLHYNLGLSHLALEELEAAAAAFAQAAQLAPPQEACAHAKLGLVLSRLGRHPEAINAFLECSDRNLAYLDTRHEESAAWNRSLDSVVARGQGHTKK